jgi:hypothetical protein
MDANLWQKFTWPLTNWAKNDNKTTIDTTLYRNWKIEPHELHLKPGCVPEGKNTRLKHASGHSAALNKLEV